MITGPGDAIMGLEGDDDEMAKDIVNQVSSIITKQTAEAVKNASESSQDLAALAQNLQQSVNGFKLRNGNGSSKSQLNRVNSSQHTYDPRSVNNT
jgi:hypothetical protein